MQSPINSMLAIQIAGTHRSRGGISASQMDAVDRAIGRMFWIMFTFIAIFPVLGAAVVADACLGTRSRVTSRVTAVYATDYKGHTTYRYATADHGKINLECPVGVKAGDTMTYVVRTSYSGLLPTIYLED